MPVVDSDCLADCQFVGLQRVRFGDNAHIDTKPRTDARQGISVLNRICEITTNDLKFYNSALKYDWESGEFVIMVGGNSRDVKSQKVNWVK